MPAIMTPPALPAWALPFACSMSERGAPHFLAKLYSARYSFLRHVICLNAAFPGEPDWGQLSCAIGGGAGATAGEVAGRLLELPIKRLVELGELLRLSPVLAAVLRKTKDYLAPYTYRDLAMLERRPDATCRVRALKLAPILCRDQVEVILEIDPAFVHPAIAGNVACMGVKKFNRIAAEIRTTCDPSAEEALMQALSARHEGEGPDIDEIIRSLVQAHYTFPSPRLRDGAKLRVIDTIAGLKAAGAQLRNCLGSHVARRILAGEPLSIVLCEMTLMVALLKPITCGARKAWLVVDIGAFKNRSLERQEQDKFISYINMELEDPVWRAPDDQRRRFFENGPELGQLFQ